MHLAFFPKADEDLIDEKAEERMDLVRTLVGTGTRNERKRTYQGKTAAERRSW